MRSASMSEARATSLQPAGSRCDISVSATASGMRVRKVWCSVKRSASEDDTTIPFRLLFTPDGVHVGQKTAGENERDEHGGHCRSAGQIVKSRGRGPWRGSLRMAGCLRRCCHTLAVVVRTFPTPVGGPTDRGPPNNPSSTNERHYP